jgi:two-component system, OmpR family, alkaline phosphatase synthesis response regulator PhoP
MAQRTILVVEDEAAIRRALVDALGSAGYRTRDAGDGQAGLAAALAGDVDLVLLDIMMPKMDGVAVLREIRRSLPALPVIFLTAKGTEDDRIHGLRAGADDYVVKPFGPREVLARVEAVLRRAGDRPKSARRLSIGGRSIDLERREITLTDGSRRTIPDLEARLLEYLAARAGRVIPRDELLMRVWNIDARGVQTRTVDMAIARLRELLDDDSANPGIIITVRAKGYLFEGGSRERGSDSDGSGPRSATGDASEPATDDPASRERARGEETP